MFSCFFTEPAELCKRSCRSSLCLFLDVRVGPMSCVQPVVGPVPPQPLSLCCSHVSSPSCYPALLRSAQHWHRRGACRGCTRPCTCQTVLLCAFPVPCSFVLLLGSTWGLENRSWPRLPRCIPNRTLTKFITPTIARGNAPEVWKWEVGVSWVANRRSLNGCRNL